MKNHVMKHIILLIISHLILGNAFRQISFSSLKEVFAHADKNSSINLQVAVKGITDKAGIIKE